MGWIEFAAAFVVFLGSHSLMLRPAVKGRIVTALGARSFTLIYSLVSLVALGWLIQAAGRAPYVEIWPYAAWQNHVTLLAMAVVCLVVAAAIGRPNPFSFGGARTQTFRPDRPGMVRWIRHPMLAALAIWSGAHLVPNGDLAHVILFGVFLGFSLLGMRIIDRRKTTQMGPEKWRALIGEVKAGPALPTPMSWPLTFLRMGGAVGFYLFLIWLHPWFAGVSPLI